MIDSDTGVDSRFNGTLYFAGNRVAQVSAALDLPGGSGCEWIGTKGSMRLTMQANAEEMTISLLSSEGDQQWTSDRIVPFALQVEDFTREVLHREGAHEAGMDALQQMKVLDALRSANRSSCRAHL